MAKENKPEENQENILNPFWLREVFPDPQGIFSVSHKKIDEIKSDCFVALDANVLLLPYKLENISLQDVIKVYRKLSDESRLVIPPQAAREFAKHRASKVSEIVKYLREQSSLSGPILKKKVGALNEHAGYLAVKQEVEALCAQIQTVQKKIRDVADEIAMDVGEDPVSVAYRGVFQNAVCSEPQDCSNETDFNTELRARYQSKRPPGYKDSKKEDSGSGDLIIWKTLLQEGKTRAKDCIFVTGDEKTDWYVQSEGPFQPRLELIEEYREATARCLHIIPLSKLLKLFEASEEAIASIAKAEDRPRAPKDIVLRYRGPEIIPDIDEEHDYELNFYFQKMKKIIDIKIENNIELTNQEYEYLKYLASKPIFSRVGKKIRNELINQLRIVDLRRHGST